MTFSSTMMKPKPKLKLVNGRYVVDRKDYYKKYYLANKEKLNAKSRQYYLNNRDHCNMVRRKRNAEKRQLKKLKEAQLRPWIRNS